MPPMQAATMQLPIQMTHHQPRVEEKTAIENYYKPEQQAVEAGDYKVPTAMGVGTTMSAIPGAGMTAVGMGNALQGLGGMPGLAQFGVAGMGLGVGSVDLNQQILAAQQRQYEMSAAIVKAQMSNNAAAAAAAAAAVRAQPKPAAPPSRKSAPSSYEPPVQLTASGRPARARRVNYAELAGALQDDEEEDDQANLVPNWARRRRKTSDQDRDYGVGVGSGARASNVQMGGVGNNPAMYGVAGAGGFNTAPRAAAPTAGVNLYGLGGQAAAGLRSAVGGATSAGLQANLAAAGIAGNAALAGQAGWQGQVVWGQNPAMGGYGALQSLAAAQRPQVAAQQFLLPPGAARGVAPNIMQDMQLMLSRGADGQGGMPGAGQQR
ncbi:hypothetical protein VOLCADRAFT_96140 [Volvox carteri f. nagariensis]|uniref:Uncharacterized protein n=1 Tax=Volvox carteri f. nagariensis TaxID=3068 RepID=D8U9B4_VOLCA|nr:uncharacterized protein VOLCADRAFT_96140 [Volvox carteri f. nagariensis]EFJ43725.1 hypothetical protein VOLCADRAFT_96140 [Volvox carteri f. nagariensis]|eukprot:XP_002955206.1 hypothetical protein VOLCADRAFT_96140 [Volvox carteri f. nagariensis]